MVKFIHLPLPIIRSIFKIRINTEFNRYQYNGRFSTHENQLDKLNTYKFTMKFPAVHSYYNIFKNTIDFQLYKTIVSPTVYLYELNKNPFKKYVDILSSNIINICRYLVYVYSLYLNNRIIIYDMNFYNEYYEYKYQMLFINDEISYYTFNKKLYNFDIYSYIGVKYSCILDAIISPDCFQYPKIYEEIKLSTNSFDKYHNINSLKYIVDFHNSGEDEKKYIEISKNLLISI